MTDILMKIGVHHVGKNNEGNVKGTADNAEIVIKPTSDINSIKSALNNMNPDKKSYFTNLQAGIRLANNSFSNEVNKILISLYDGAPSVAIGVKSDFSYGLIGEYRTAEEGARAKYNAIASKTCGEILTLKNNAVSFILLRPGDKSYNAKYYSSSTGALVADFDGSEYVKKLYGTIENPTYGKMYAYTSENLDKVITEDIYKEVEKSLPSTLKDIKVTNYFTDEIVNNFNFSYVGKASIGDASQEINIKNNSIEWNIPELDGNKTASLKYKLTLKDGADENILEKLINVSNKVEVSYNINGQSYSSNLTDTPQLKISKVEVKEEPNVEDDAKEEKNEVKPNDWRKNPNTGMYV